MTDKRPATSRPRVVLVDDHALVRAGVSALIADRVDIVGEADDVQPAVELVVCTKPDVVLLDVHLPSATGDAVIRAVLPELPDTRFLALSVSDAAEDVIRVIRAGARGYVTKTIGADALVNAIEQVAAGDAVFSPRLAGFVLDAFTSDRADVAAAASDIDVLSMREREVLQVIARGYTYREAAEELFLSVKTIETHVSAVLRKLQLSNRRELARWASERRLLPERES